MTTVFVALDNEGDQVHPYALLGVAATFDAAHRIIERTAAATCSAIVRDDTVDTPTWWFQEDGWLRFLIQELEVE